MTYDILRRNPALRQLLREPTAHENANESSRPDFLTKDGQWAIDIAMRPRGVRELSADALSLSRWVARHPEMRACLVAVEPRISPDRLRREWTEIQQVLRKDVAQRIALVTSEDERDVPDRPTWLVGLLEALRESEDDDVLAAMRPATPSRKFFEVVKLLLLRWFRHEDPMAVLELAHQAGCSYPTVYKGLQRLESYGELSRTSDRRVALPGFPLRTWDEILALLPTLRETATFIDASGGAPDPVSLLARLERQAPPGIALGGVEAARHWDPHFDLNGLPRLDLVVHAPQPANLDLSFVAKLDPALKQTQPMDPAHRHSVVLAVHRLSRSVPIFETDPKRALPLADPVEVLMDLYDLRLIDQAVELLHRLRYSA